MTDIPEELTVAGWACEEGGLAIIKHYRFSDFRSAMAWMMRAAFEAEAINHHPEWRNVYNRVEVRLTTHDENGLTPKDYDLARLLDSLGA